MALTPVKRRRDALESDEAAIPTCVRDQAEVLLRFEADRDHGPLPDLRLSARGVFRPGRSGRARSRGAVAPARTGGGDGDRPRPEAERASGGSRETREGEGCSFRPALSGTPG